MLQSTNHEFPSNESLILPLWIFILQKSILTSSKSPVFNQKNKVVVLVFFICAFMVQQTCVSAQTILLDRKTNEITAEYLKDIDNNLTIDDILNGNYGFQPIADSSIDDLDASYWIRLDFQNEINTLETQQLWRLRTLHFSEAILFYQHNGAIEQKAFGKFNSPERRLSFKYSNGVAFNTSDLIENRYLYLKIKAHLTPKGVEFSYTPNDSNRFFTHYYTSSDLKVISLHQVFLGACLIFFLTFLVIYFKVLKLEFLFYSLYVLCLGIYLGGFYISVSLPDTKFGYWLIVVSQVAINIFYVLFAIHYLETKKNYPGLHTLLVLIIPILLAVILSDFIAFRLDKYSVKLYILNFQRFLMTLFGLLSMLYLLFRAKDKLAYFIVIGSFSYMAGALGLLFTNNQYLMIVGGVVEILLFSWGLAYKIKREYEAKLTLQQEVSLKEISALQSQMNPHFIFNSLNSIQHLIIQNDKVSALNYLSKFAKITRNVLESSHMAMVPLAEEINLLKSYLELESLRFDNSFDYTIEIDKNLDIEHIEIPLMLIQPFVENALIHGLIGKKAGEKKLNLRFLNNRDHYVIEIEDNGIGRHHKTHKLRNKKEKSHGIRITEKRLKMIEENNQNKNSVVIVDKYDSNSQPNGTKVIVKIYNP